MKVIVIGAGNMGGALIDRWRSSDGLVVVSVDPATETSASTDHFNSLEMVPKDPVDFVVLAVKPHQIVDVLKEVQQTQIVAAGVVSIAAGVERSTIRSHLKGGIAVRAMPTLPARIGYGMTALFDGDELPVAQRQALDSLFKEVGQTLWVKEEDQIDQFTAVAGSGPGYIFEIMRAYADAVTSLGFSDEDAERLAIQTFRGASALAEEAGGDLVQLRDAVTSKGGPTAAGLTVLGRGANMESVFQDVFRAAYRRALELKSDR